MTINDATGAAAWTAASVCAAALVPSGLRWMRVAQREHYLPGSCTRFAIRWWTRGPLNVAGALIGIGAVVLSAWWPLIALGSSAVAIALPAGLGIRGRTSRLQATRRLRALLATWLVLQAAVVVVGGLAGRPAIFAAAGLVGVPLLVDVAAALNAPLERRLLRPFVEAASTRLERVSPVVVAVTGSYGKTSTKSHIAHLVTGSKVVLASPASFNNRAGLSRAINEQLSDGTEVFIAEMGTYRRGEIADLCSWVVPSIAVITAIGPVHLERFGSEDEVLRAKAEITVRADKIVLNVDDPRLSGLSDTLEEDPSKTVIRCSASDPNADVCVMVSGGAAVLSTKDGKLAEGVPFSPGLVPTNVACAVAVALALGVDPSTVAARIADLPAVPHRLSLETSTNGVLVLDDTFNSNPAGARLALETLASVGGGRRRAVVTPGMVELGPRQDKENEAFADAASRTASDLVVVGRTNRRSLLRGARNLSTVVLRDRQDAVGWVRANLGEGDAVLYENDLPDHYP